MFVKKGTKRFKPTAPADRSNREQTAAVTSNLPHLPVAAASQPAAARNMAHQHGHDLTLETMTSAGNQENVPNATADQDASVTSLQPEQALHHTPSSVSHANDLTMDDSKDQSKERKRKVPLSGVQHFRVAKSPRLGDAIPRATDSASSTCSPPAPPSGPDFASGSTSSSPSESPPSPALLGLQFPPPFDDVQSATNTPNRPPSPHAVPIPIPSNAPDSRSSVSAHTVIRTSPPRHSPSAGESASVRANSVGRQSSGTFPLGQPKSSASSSSKNASGSRSGSKRCSSKDESGSRSGGKRSSKDGSGSHSGSKHSSKDESGSHSGSKRSSSGDTGYPSSIKRRKRHPSALQRLARAKGSAHDAAPPNSLHKLYGSSGIPKAVPFRKKRVPFAAKPGLETVPEEDVIPEDDFTGHYASSNVRQQMSPGQQTEEYQEQQPLERAREEFEITRCQPLSEADTVSLREVLEECDDRRDDAAETPGSASVASSANASSPTVSIQDKPYVPVDVRWELQSDTHASSSTSAASPASFTAAPHPRPPTSEIGSDSRSLPHIQTSNTHMSVSQSSTALQSPSSSTPALPQGSPSLFDIMKNIGKEQPDDCSPQMKALLSQVGAANPALLKYDPATRSPPTKEWPYLPEGVEQKILLTPVKHRVQPLKDVTPLLKKREQYQPLPPLDPSLPRRSIRIKDVKQTVREFEALLEPKPRRKGKTVPELREQVEKEREFDQRREAMLKRHIPIPQVELVDGEIRLKEPTAEPELEEAEESQSEREPEPEAAIPSEPDLGNAETAGNLYRVEEEDGEHNQQLNTKAKSKRTGKTWSESERILLYEALKEHKGDWDKVADAIPNRTYKQVRRRTKFECERHPARVLSELGEDHGLPYFLY
ncbi:hypothetical protein BCR43DRAFT_484692 [Syncephalastrum racemosum]|uniref:Uncharacterized protein n=1 Tax=Syncephalastrum racemosum TaxID=13706 RepID=A0A1X2HLF4_SYNRA|nr:hypothetical protein BCR43DRAFT_484692 [Syncephalastrum racemosum]